jgi:3-hydroxyacyl-CoA dehydrogenase
MRVLIVGAGLMGTQIGCEYALGGHDVTLVARDTERVAERVRRAFALVEAERLAPGDAVIGARARVTIAAALEGETARCDLAVESLPESLDVKLRLLAVVAEAAPDAILASNTSSIPISTLGDSLGEPERVIGTHYLNPPLLMPTVELVPGPRTHDRITRRLLETLAELGKLPVVVRRDVPGFIWNRLQFALLRECVWLVDEGVAAPEEVDLVLREGLARRWRHVGPFAAIRLGGLDTWMRSAANLVPELSTAADLGDLARFPGPDGPELERLAAARDGALARELRGGD